jgi:hypothetical protein
MKEHGGCDNAPPQDLVSAAAQVLTIMLGLASGDRSDRQRRPPDDASSAMCRVVHFDGFTGSNDLRAFHLGSWGVRPVRPAPSRETVERDRTVVSAVGEADDGERGALGGWHRSEAAGSI